MQLEERDNDLIKTKLKIDAFKMKKKTTSVILFGSKELQ